jgi:hypothetical protein
MAQADNLVVNVSSQGDPTTWTPATTNTAFARTLQFGTKLVKGAAIAPFISLVWTDAAVYLFQYTGSLFLYNSSLAGLNCGLISPNGMASVDGIAYWMGPDNFYMYAGSVTPMPNVEDIRKYVFDAISGITAFQVNAVYVPKYHEIHWFYTTGGAQNPTAYVIYHINDQCWSVGNANFYSSVGVTAGVASGSHFPAGDTSPFMAHSDGYLQLHTFLISISRGIRRLTCAPRGGQSSDHSLTAFARSWRDAGALSATAAARFRCSGLNDQP